MLSTVCTALLELHRYCRLQSVEEFPVWAMDLVSEVIPHDAFLWEKGGTLDGEIVMNTFRASKIPVELIWQWKLHMRADSIAPMFCSNAGKALNFTHAELCVQVSYQSSLREYGIGQMMGIYYPNEQAHLHDAVFLCRADPENSFSESERLTFESLTPHLVEAQRANYLGGWLCEGKSIICEHPRATADHKGFLFAADDDFINLLRQEWPDWQGPVLPHPVREAFQQEMGEIRGREIAIKHFRVKDITHLEIRQQQPPALVGLTGREYEIGLEFVKGMSYKEIAAKYRISPSTVRNHLGAIYRKLKIASRAELTTVFSKTA